MRKEQRRKRRLNACVSAGRPPQRPGPRAASEAGDESTPGRAAEAAWATPLPARARTQGGDLQA